MSNVYLIRQDMDHLYGEVLKSAVVIAHSVGDARATLSDYLGNVEDVVWNGTFWSFQKIGNNAKSPINHDSVVVCMETETREGMPPGDYKPLNKHGEMM